MRLLVNHGMIKIPRYIKYSNYRKTHTIKFKGHKHIKIEMLVRLKAQNENFTFYKCAFSSTQQPQSNLKTRFIIYQQL